MIYYFPTQSPPPPATPANTIAFEYCIVQLSWNWFSGDLLASPGWYIQGVHKGDFASGPLAGTGNEDGAASVAAAQTLETGIMPYVPTAFIAVRKLVLNLEALGLDKTSAGNATSFGPFSLAPVTGSSNTLASPGIQIIGWICTAQPQIPPETDPALIPDTTSLSDEIPSNLAGIEKDLSGLFGEFLS